MVRPALLLLALGGAACQPVPLTPEEAARVCEQRARDAQGPTGEVAVGASSGDGPFLGLEIGLSSDYLSGRDPFEVYDSCVRERTGTAPIRPPSL
jgi:hypothetical protein